MPEDRARMVRASFKRSLSDGAYGTEGAEVSFEWFVDENDSVHEDQEIAQEMLKAARDLVMLQLRQSGNSNVRRAAGFKSIASPGPAATAPGDDVLEELPF